MSIEKLNLAFHNTVSFRSVEFKPRKHDCHTEEWTLDRQRN